MTKQQSMKRLRRNETQSRELYQLISDHLNDDKVPEFSKQYTFGMYIICSFYCRHHRCKHFQYMKML